MKNIEDIIKEIHEAFGNNEYRGDPFIQGSFEGWPEKLGISYQKFLET